MNENVPKVIFLEGIIQKKEESAYNEILQENRPLPHDFIIKITNGPEEEISKEVRVFSESLNYPVNTKVYLRKDVYPQESLYILLEKNRYTEITFSVLIFTGLVVVLFGKKGLKALFSLVLTFGILFAVLIPSTLSGYNPVILAGGISFILLSVIMLVTHGNNKVTYAALLGSSFSVFITILLSYVIVEQSLLTGQTDSVWSFLTFTAGKEINFSLLVIASMIIGTIGAVDDAAVTQASVVSELKKLNPGLSIKEYYKRAMNVGSDHAGALVNTLILAYVATALPLLLVLYVSPTPAHILISQEYMVTEIFRSLISSAGLLLAIPLTTLCAAYLLSSKDHSVHTHRHADHNH